MGTFNLNFKSVTLFISILFLSACSEEDPINTCNEQFGHSENCKVPENLIVEKLDCNTYKLILESEDNYGTTLWNSDDLIPTQRQTETGALNVTVSTSGPVSDIYGQTKCCVEGMPTIYEFRFKDVVLRSILRSPEWLDAPPTSASLGEVIVLTLKNEPEEGEDLAVEWSSSDGISIQGPGSTARIKCDQTGEHWVRVTYLNECTNEEIFLQEEIFIF